MTTTRIRTTTEEWNTKVAIRVTPETREELKEIGNKGETYNDTIRKLIRAYRAERHDIKETIKEAEA